MTYQTPLWPILFNNSPCIAMIVLSSSPIVHNSTLQCRQNNSMQPIPKTPPFFHLPTIPSSKAWPCLLTRVWIFLVSIGSNSEGKLPLGSLLFHVFDAITAVQFRSLVWRAFIFILGTGDGNIREKRFQFLFKKYDFLLPITSWQSFTSWLLRHNLFGDTSFNRTNRLEY